MPKAGSTLNTAYFSALENSVDKPVLALMFLNKSHERELDRIDALRNQEGCSQPAWCILDSEWEARQDQQVDCWASLSRQPAKTPIELLAKGEVLEKVLPDWLAGTEIFSGTEDLVLSWILDLIRCEPQHRPVALKILCMVLSRDKTSAST